MCGINGILRLRESAPAISRTELIRTRDYMYLRGPDDTGEWVLESGEIGFGHLRLAIIDLSPAGAQPMSWENGRYWITFNGEIYNYAELRAELIRDGAPLKTHSDTEVILALYARQGTAMFPRLRGMYAFAIWDTHTHRLLLARDPYGIKPLYYSSDGDYLRFASQVKALEVSGAISREPDPAGVAGFLLWGSVPEPFTIRHAVRAVPAGHYVLVECGKIGAPCAHYDWRAPVANRYANVQEALQDTVQAHLVADVPVAIFLSAGLDSTLLTALACRTLPTPPQTFSLGFTSFLGKPWDELPLAAEVAKTLGTHHIEQRVSPTDLPDLWSHTLAAMDQPSVDGFNVFVISQFAQSAGLKVVLSGLGGDELFGSYSSFHDVPRWTKWSSIARRIPGLHAVWSQLAQIARPTQPKLAGLLRYGGDIAGAYYLRRGVFLPEELPALIGSDMAHAGLATYDPIARMLALTNGPGTQTDGCSAWEHVHQLESGQYMRNQLLRDADWASMAHSLELRVPLVDVRLREYLCQTGFEPARHQGKAALVQQVAPELPTQLFTRRKSGFMFPVMEWLDPSVPRDPPRWGMDSRRLALRVLGEFVDIQR
ncbi:MAG: asparagine synthase (glutamine-hydrolyzing) [Chloroflexi bacterium]|nr:asparagine synthase (glutamine-hydrolyzing) [Chloroflexota bacterium]